MSPDSQDQAPPETADSEEKEAAKVPEVDLQALAREILALLKRELQLERERCGRV